MVGCNRYWGTTFEQRIEQQREVCYWYKNKIQAIGQKGGRSYGDTLHLLLLHLEFADNIKRYKNMVDIYKHIIDNNDTSAMNHLTFYNLKQ
jgi:hypothetical protein